MALPSRTVITFTQSSATGPTGRCTVRVRANKGDHGCLSLSALLPWCGTVCVMMAMTFQVARAVGRVFRRP